MDLLKQYSLLNIVEFIVLLALGIKGFISFIEWGFPRLKKVIKKTQQSKEITNNLSEQIKEINDIKDAIKNLSKKIDILTESDKDDIKAFITRQHHYFVYQRGWIDDYSLDCIEQRYRHYQEEGGNSFINTLMKEIRALPKQQPPKE